MEATRMVDTFWIGMVATAQVARAVKLYDSKCDKSREDDEAKAELDRLHRDFPWVKPWIDAQRRSPGARPATGD